jgi:hypothetical protein
MRSALARLWLKVVELTNPPHLSADAPFAMALIVYFFMARLT